MELIAQNLLEQIILPAAGAVSGIIMGRILLQGLGSMLQELAGFGLLRIQSHKVEASHQHVRLEPIDQI